MRHSLTRIVTCLALLVPSVAWDCEATHVVGTDDGGGPGSDGGSCAGQVAPPCSPPPAGCNWVGPECVNDTLTCGTLACKDGGP
jgi:hypothetical protein